jgi:hypothetical protein
VDDSATPSVFSGTFVPVLVIEIALVALLVVAYWRVFTKAGRPGWAAIIPIYNVYVLCKVAGRPGWWVLLYLIPGVNFIIAIIISVDVAKAFGKGGAFGFFLLFLLPFIGYPILAFGGAQYQGRGGSGYGGPDPGYPPPPTSYPPPGDYRGY